MGHHSTIITAAIALLSLSSCSKVSDVEIAQYRDGAKAAISFTFDDGIIDHYELVAPALERRGMRGTFWIIGSTISNDPESKGMNWDKIREMEANGHEIGSHGWKHINLLEATPEERLEEIVRNDSVFVANLGHKALTFCYPFNAFDDEIVKLCSAGRVGTRTFQKGMGQQSRHSTTEELQGWLKQTVDKGEWGVTMIHGIHNGWDQWVVDENVLWNFFDEVSAAMDSVWVAPFKDVSAYIAERDSCSLTVEQKSFGKVIVKAESSLDPALFTEPLTLKYSVGGETRYTSIDPNGGTVTLSPRKNR